MARPGSAASAHWLQEFLLLAAIWGASFMFMQLAVRDFGPWATAGIRVGIAAATLLPLMLLRGQWRDLRQHWKPTLFVGIFNSGLPFACYAYALLTIPTGWASILNATTPLFTACIAWFWLGHRPDRWRLLGLLIGFIGVALLASSKPAGLSDDISHGHALLASLACLLATCSYGFAACYSTRYLSQMPAMAVAAGSNFGAFLVLLPLTVWFAPTRMPGSTAWLAMLAVGVICTGLAYVLYYRLIARAGPGNASTITYLIPVFALAYGVGFMNESLSWSMLVYGSVILLGTMLSTGWLSPKKFQK